MIEFLDNLKDFVSSGFFGLAISGVFYGVFYLFTKDKLYVERKHLVVVFCAALVVCLLPQMKELLFGTNPDDLLAVGWGDGGGLRAEPTNTVTASAIGKTLGCLVGFLCGKHLLRRFDF